MRKRVGRIRYGRMDRIRAKLWIGIDNLSVRGALGQFSQHELDSDARIANDRFAKHHARVNTDVVPDVHTDTVREMAFSFKR
jgi:hypothetical protein